MKITISIIFFKKIENHNQTRKFKNDRILNDGNVNPIIYEVLCIYQFLLPNTPLKSILTKLCI